MSTASLTARFAALGVTMLVTIALFGFARTAHAQPAPSRYVLMDTSGNRVVVFCSADKVDGMVAAQQRCPAHREALIKADFRDVQSSNDYAPTATLWTSNCYVDHLWRNNDIVVTTNCAGTEAHAMDRRIRTALGLK